MFSKLVNIPCSQSADFVTVGVRTVTRRPVLSCVHIPYKLVDLSACCPVLWCCMLRSRWIASAQLFANCRDLRNTFCCLNAVVLLPDWYSAAARYS